MSIGQDSFLTSLPSGWMFDRFKDVALLRNERTDEASEVEDYLELEDLESGTGRILNRRNTMDVISDVTVFKKGDVLFGKLRPYLEKYYIAEFDGKCTGEILAFKPERIESRFLFYCLGSSWFIERCNMLAYGAKMPRVNWPTQLAQFNLPLPPLPEQQRIAAYLDASCAAIDAAMTAKRRQLDTLDILRKTTIHNATIKGTNPHVGSKHLRNTMFDSIPEHWKVDRFKDVVLLRNEKTDQPSENEDYLELEDMESGTGQILSRRNTLEVGSAVTVFEKGDILFGKLRPYLEKYYEAEFDGKCTGEILAFKPTRVRGHFLFYCIASPWFITRCSILAYGAKMPRVNWPTQLAQFNLPLPPIEEQDAICAFLDSKLAEIKSIRRSIESQIATLTAYRKSLIHECVTGQRRITEADVMSSQLSENTG